MVRVLSWPKCAESMFALRHCACFRHREDIYHRAPLHPQAAARPGRPIVACAGWLRGAARNPQFFVPIVFALNTTIQYFQALVIFDEFAELPWHQVVLSGFGAVLSFVGAMLIRPREESTNSDSLWNDSATSGISLRPMHTEPDGPDEMF